MGFGDPEWVRKWVLDEENSRPIIRKALELGMNFFDTANVYSNGRSDETVGKALRDFARRDGVVIATKVFWMRVHLPTRQASVQNCWPGRL